jgi:hypothetical protein
MHTYNVVHCLLGKQNYRELGCIFQEQSSNPIILKSIHLTILFAYAIEQVYIEF